MSISRRPVSQPVNVSIPTLNHDDHAKPTSERRRQYGKKRIWTRKEKLARGASGKEQADEKAEFTQM
jgi:hypothetical protein